MKILLIIALAFLFFSCEIEKEYAVNSEFDTYVQRFINEGNIRGKSYDFHKEGLIIEFGDNKGEYWAGICHCGEDPIRIEVDATSWYDLEGSKNEDLRKEELIFHELGHAFIEIEHRNKIFALGDFASIMSGGNGANPPDARKSWNVNYRGFRRDYYINELFEPNTPRPNWANLQPFFFDNPDEELIFKDDFSSNVNNWSVAIKEDRQTEITNGYYKIQTLGDKGYYYAKTISLDKEQDFYIEVNMKFSPQGNDGGNWHDAGLVWGGSEGENLYYLKYTKDQRLVIGNFINYGWYIELPCTSLKINNFNKIVIKKVDAIFYLFVNDTFVYHTDYDSFLVI